MLLEISILVLLAIFASAGNVTRMVARSVGELQPTLLSAQSPRLRRYEVTGTVVFFLSLAGTAAWGVLVAGSIGLPLTWMAIGDAGLVLIVLVVAEVSRSIAHNRLDSLARPFLGDAAAFLPLIEPHEQVQEPEEKREEALEEMVEAGEKVGLIESGEREMISGVIGLDTTAVREIMIPRIDVVGVDVNTPISAALDVIVSGAHSRIPVYEESLDHVVGLLYAKDLLKALHDGKSEGDLRSMVRPAHFVPESKPVDELLQELQQSKVHMSIVVDEYGGTAGIVTIEDILEEIVGEIQDEYDVAEEPQFELITEGEAIFDARVNIDQVNETLGLQLPDENDSLAGLVNEQLQRIAKVGDQIHVHGALISVISVIRRRIIKVRVTKQAPSIDLVPSLEGAGQTQSNDTDASSATSAENSKADNTA